ncbi:MULTISPECIES: hypothetical protein [unclassified Sporosarcina]|uniref:hypothetical protein n=1 Tax=unclassified Sporosarcina TaxID=2647733 RepID=UPI002041F6A9|nr:MULTISPECIES: hypothetical protein [unclassified Sporosarcina]GKV65475.1 hypothetical protein NCCP2331_16280 [Sporosarcina sp. NCCP-2331]GLB55599.1 hypothetical protein NCCP2378_13860 [Sporosarcina sp. NCCP-2378]
MNIEKIVLKTENSWHGKSGETLKCPFPDCHHRANLITLSHCRLEHGMEREEIGELYGVPKRVHGLHYKFGQAFTGERGD